MGWFALLAVPGALLVAVATRRRGGLSQPAAVPVALLAVAVLQLVAQPLQAAVSRRYEAEADWMALEATRDPRSARGVFERLSATALADPDPPGWAVFWDGHPAMVRRIAMVDAWEARKRRERAPTARR